MADRRRDLAMLTSVVIAAALVFFGAKKTVAFAASPLDAVPATSFLVISVDVAQLRNSPLFATIFGKNRLFGVESLRESCGFDPLTRIEELDVAVPEGGDSGDFGVAASGAMNGDELAACAQKILATRGSLAHVKKDDAFTRISDEHGTRLAFREGGPFLVGRGTWLEAMIAAQTKQAPSIRASSVHASLRAALASHGKNSVIVATAILPQELRDRLKKEMGAEAPGNEGAEAMAGVLGVSSAGLSLRAVGSDDEPTIEADLELRCETADACAQVQRLAEKKRLAWSKDFGMRLIGLGPLIDELRVEAHGTTLTASTHARASDVSAAVDRILKVRGSSPEPRAIQPKKAPPPVPDEVLKPKRP